MFKNDERRSLFAGIILSASTLVALPVLAHQSGQMIDQDGGFYHEGMMNYDSMMGGQNMMGYSGMMNESPFMQHHEGHYGFGMMRTLRKLNLTEKQRKQINTLQDQLRKQHWNQMGLIMDQQSTIRDALNDDRPDPSKVGEAYAIMFDHQRKMIESKIETRNKIMDLLNEKQRKEIQELEWDED